MSIFYKYSILTIITLLCISCTHPRPTKDEIVGTWYGPDNAKLVIYKNGSMNIENLPINNLFDNNLSPFKGTAKWSIVKSESVSPFWIIEIYLNDNINTLGKDDNMGFEVMIERNGLGGNGSEIKNLFIWEGDPDSADRFQFEKASKKHNRN